MGLRTLIGYSFDVAVLAGLVVVGVGIYAMSTAAAWIYAGAVLLGAGLFGAKLYVQFLHGPAPAKAPAPREKEVPEDGKLDFVGAPPSSETSLKSFFE